MGRSDTTAKSAVAKASVRVVKSGSSAANVMAVLFVPSLGATKGRHIALHTQGMRSQRRFVNAASNARADAESLVAPNSAHVIASDHLVPSMVPFVRAASSRSLALNVDRSASAVSTSASVRYMAGVTVHVASERTFVQSMAAPVSARAIVQGLAVRSILKRSACANTVQNADEGRENVSSVSRRGVGGGICARSTTVAGIDAWNAGKQQLLIWASRQTTLNEMVQVATSSTGILTRTR